MGKDLVNWCEKRRISPVMHWVSCGKNPLLSSADCLSTASSRSKEEVPEAQHLGNSRSRLLGCVMSHQLSLAPIGLIGLLALFFKVKLPLVPQRSPISQRKLRSRPAQLSSCTQSAVWRMLDEWGLSTNLTLHRSPHRP